MYNLLKIIFIQLYINLVQKSIVNLDFPAILPIASVDYATQVPTALFLVNIFFKHWANCDWIALVFCNAW